MRAPKKKPTKQTNRREKNKVSHASVLETGGTEFEYPLALTSRCGDDKVCIVVERSSNTCHPTGVTLEHTAKVELFTHGQ